MKLGDAGPLEGDVGPRTGDWAPSPVGISASLPIGSESLSDQSSLLPSDDMSDDCTGALLMLEPLWFPLSLVAGAHFFLIFKMTNLKLDV
jgi:hypothetical protein